LLVLLFAAPLVVAQSTDTDPTDSLSRYIRKLEARVSALEEAMSRYHPQEPPVEPPVVPPVEPPVVPPIGGWPVAPTVSLVYDSRADDPVPFTIAPVQWEAREGRRFCKAAQTVEQTQFIVWFEQVEGLDATRVTVAAINGLYGVGPAYFEHYRVTVGHELLADIRGRNVIPPRFAIFRRLSVGPDADVLGGWTYLPTDPALPQWAASKAAKDTAKRTAFPFQRHNGKPVDIGPYNFFWPDHSLSDSHGGYGVAPFHGGPDDWLVCPEGRANREAEMLLDFQRPIWMLNADYTPFSPFVSYWMGRTSAHEPPGYRYTVDDWCPYASELITYKFYDLSHLSRGTSGAAALAAYDIVGEACLEMVFTDFKTAYSLDPNHPGKDQGNFLLFPLWKKIEVTNGPGNGGDRSLAHLLRLLRWCRPYFDTEPYDVAMRAFTRKLSDAYGMTNAGSAPWAANPAVMSDPLTQPINYTFHQQLVLYEESRFGGLDDLVAKARRFLTKRPPAAFEVRSGDLQDTVFDRHNTATVSQDRPKWGYPCYGQMTHGVWVGFDNAQQFAAAMEARGVNGSSQDYDCTPRSLWAENEDR